MSVNSKILNIEELKKYYHDIMQQGKSIVLCQGHFNVIHPGHLRFIEFAKKQGDVLIVAVQGSKWLDEKNLKLFFASEERAQSVASLFNVDKVIVFEDESILNVIQAVKPSVYVKGEEFIDDEATKKEQKLVEKLNGKVKFNSGQVQYSTSEFLVQDLTSISKQNQDELRQVLDKNAVLLCKLKDRVKSFINANILVIGDTIVDEYIACDALGMSAEAPVLNIREIGNKSFTGGAAVVARHIKSLGANSSFVSVVGDDEPARFVSEQLKSEGINADFIVEEDRQTTFKIRYMVGNQKILRVSRLDEHNILEASEIKIINKVKELANTLDGIVFSDFGYGVITENLIKEVKNIAKENSIKLFGDSQSSSQIGDVSKFKDFDLITPTEKEARLALKDKYNGLERLALNLVEKTKVQNLAITLAEKGFVTYQKKEDVTVSNHLPALNSNPVDVMGAGDSLLSALSISMCSGLSLVESSILASGVASIAVGKVGNIPVTNDELISWIDEVNEICRK